MRTTVPVASMHATGLLSAELSILSLWCTRVTGPTILLMYCGVAQTLTLLPMFSFPKSSVVLQVCSLLSVAHFSSAIIVCVCVCVCVRVRACVRACVCLFSFFSFFFLSFLIMLLAFENEFELKSRRANRCNVRTEL